MPYIPTSIAKPAPLTDVIGLVHDDDGLTRLMVFLHPDGRWLVSQSEFDIEYNVIAWTALPPLPSQTNSLLWHVDKRSLGWLCHDERPACIRCKHCSGTLLPLLRRLRHCRLGAFTTSPGAICDQYEPEEA
jgi:hypothetical protein